MELHPVIKESSKVDPFSFKAQRISPCLVCIEITNFIARSKTGKYSSKKSLSLVIK